MPPPRLDRDTVAAVQHDLRSPLTAIKGRAQLAARDVARSPTLDDAERERILRHLSAIEEGVERACGYLDALARDDG